MQLPSAFVKFTTKWLYRKINKETFLLPKSPKSRPERHNFRYYSNAIVSPQQKRAFETPLQKSEFLQKQHITH